MFNNTSILSVRHFRKPVFSKATVDTEVVIAKKANPPKDHKVEIIIVERDGTTSRYNVSQSQWQSDDGAPINIFESPEISGIVAKFERFPVLDSLAIITQGTKPFQVGKGKPPQTRAIVEEKPYVADHKENHKFRPLLRGSLIGRYYMIWNKNYWISFGDWLAEPRYSANYDFKNKIVIRQTGDSLVATLDKRKFIVRDNLYTVISETYDPRYILGLLNSKLLNWYYQTVINPEKGEALAQVKRGHLARLPIADLHFTNQIAKVRHDRIIENVDSMLRLNKNIISVKTSNDKILIQRQIDATDCQIDQLVYELYGLSEKEIEIIENTIPNL